MYQMNTNEILENIYDISASAFTDGYDVDVILLNQKVYDAFKEENEKVLGEGNGDFDKLLIYPVQINNTIEDYMLVTKELF